ncbi:6-carboxyhexanoate--CoA ligase [Bacillus sp. REN10]|uniref:6-carboxyhexanoate--CoA ligase n=1 Tax=Bacillus sp. REN10 TaxID=2782541 RepID=UPI00193BDC10|nr:6-carboxyhexanoate--CoA ligase [Bacillus sp. REN10]
MQEEAFYSVRMRAAKGGPHEQGGKHISGGELLSTYPNMREAVNSLLDKALTHSRGNPDFVQIQFDVIDEPIKRIEPLSIKTNEVESVEAGQALARELLEQAGIKKEVINKVYEKLVNDPGMRGAMLVDVHSGERVDDRHQKGVRVSRMDWVNANFEKWADHFNEPSHSRVKEALVLATKVSVHPATVAELCWSDDPEYITGYVASNMLGYQRISHLKEHGDEQGCRIFFVDGFSDMDSYIRFLEKQPVLIQWEEE